MRPLLLTFGVLLLVPSSACVTGGAGGARPAARAPVLRMEPALKRALFDLYQRYQVERDAEVTFCLYGAYLGADVHAVGVYVPAQRGTRTTSQASGCPLYHNGRPYVGLGHSHPRGGSTDFSWKDWETFATDHGRASVLLYERDGAVYLRPYIRPAPVGT